MEWIYLSPHFDDVALSCGGLVWEQTHAGQQVSIWTICAGDTPEEPLTPFAAALHDRWQTGQEAARQRRAEDVAACERLGAAFHHFSLPDCIYRRIPGVVPGTDFHLYVSEESLFGPIHPAETGLIQALSAELEQALPEGVELVSPLALGGHVDHRLVFAAARLLKRPLWYYADYPYSRQDERLLDQLQQAGWKPFLFPVSESGRQAWVQSVAAYASQISTFWPDLTAMQADIYAYCQKMGDGACGVRLWRPPTSGFADKSV